MGLADELAALDAELMGDEPDWESEPACPESLEKADEWMTRLAFLAEEERDARQIYELRRKRVDDYLTRRLEVIEGQRVWLVRSLDAYMRARRAENPRLATIHLPHGEIKSRTQQPAWNWDDGFVPWLRDNYPGLLHEPKPPAPDANAVKKAFVVPDGAKPGDVVHPVDPATGETVTSVSVEIRDRKTSVVPAVES